jgi:very-short-patch-repair endonuclease
MNKKLTEYARRHRRQPTWAEAMLWADLRGRQLGYKFRRQQPIGPYIVDFVCFEKRLVVEVDGWTHQLEQNWEPDCERQDWLEGKGYAVLRFNDEDVRNDRGAVGDAIYSALRLPPARQPSLEGPSSS